MNIVSISNNEFGTFFIELNGQTIADSSTINRVRGFWNSETKQYIKANKFTKKQIQKNPRIVLDYLEQTGTKTDESWIVVSRIY
jgi:hypothetical protein